MPVNEIELICTGCNRHPAEIEEYVIAAKEANLHSEIDQCSYCLAMNDGYGHLSACPLHVDADRYVQQEEGTLNFQNGHFLCTACYILAGMPSSPTGWVAP